MSRIGLSRSYSVVNRLVSRMSSSLNNYEDAIQKLNSLQSNRSTIEQIKRSIKNGDQKCTNLKDMENFLARTGVPLAKLDQLSVIHVAGTKGKGSTSAMCESILRQHGFRTGFYSSPHLVAARERVRLGGRPLTEQAFADHFHRVYDMLHRTQEFEGDMPKYFAFLTVMAYNVFLAEEVDVAVVEVGIGGVVDYTNVLRKVPVVGITALGLDHTSILGHTLAEIASAKAGVMKPGCVAYTVPQPRDAMDVLVRVADQVRCPLTVAPDYGSYSFLGPHKPSLQVNLEAYRTNASLAVQLAHAWLRITQGKLRLNGFRSDVVAQNGVKRAEKPGSVQYEVPPETIDGLRLCKWPGRYQVVDSDYGTFYLDGAHTKESMEICAKWFLDNNDRHENKILIFAATGDRNSETLLKPLGSIPFKRVFFVVPTTHRATSTNNDNYSLVEHEDHLRRCKTHQETWRHHSTSNVTVLESVSETLISIKNEEIKPQVLITGSLHLVGAALSILDPNLST